MYLELVEKSFQMFSPGSKKAAPHEVMDRLVAGVVIISQ